MRRRLRALPPETVSLCPYYGPCLPPGLARQVYAKPGNALTQPEPSSRPPYSSIGTFSLHDARQRSAMAKRDIPVNAYRDPLADPDPAGAFHVDADGAPDLVIEILSRSTRKKDVGVGGKVADKMEHYRRIGIGSTIPNAWKATRTSVCSTASACKMPTTSPLRCRRGKGGRARCWVRAGYWAANSARQRTRRSR